MSEKSILSLDTIIVRSDGLVQAEIDGEVVAMNVESGNCYGLNSIGSRVWNLISDPVRIGVVCKQLQAEYEVEPMLCERQVLTLLEELYAEKLIVVG